jgi:type I restriction enzyme R subunit
MLRVAATERKLRPDWHHKDDDKGVMKIVMTGSASDPLAWQDHIRNKPRREALAMRFKNPQDPLKIALVLVRDMWLTGFDAPLFSSSTATFSPGYKRWSGR